MVRRKVEIKAIENVSKRHTTFTKRRQGLFKKAKDLCTKCEAEATVITVSKAGNIFAFGHPAVDPVVNRYLSYGNGDERVHGGNRMAAMEEEMLSLSKAERKVQTVMGKGRQEWDLAIGDLEINELDEMEMVIRDIKRIAAARSMEIVAGGGKDQEVKCFGKDSIVPYRRRIWWHACNR
ncbi:MADS-box protein AGL71-like isoform X2 [Olea europaea var. sylvestris]|uniref:MADS-box protein AGL71-like isoform X2 n=1 Tax=Olea europaea var. sylvestris TaxID=158386 RepID=UPI000C1D1595|nr:MADS-box protein AGL71-like isoform X2 [Olea europaea var. sylvestris]